MRRRFCCCLLAALLPLFLLPAAAGADDDAIGISDRAGLAAMAENPTGRYALMADIDLSGADWTPIDFSGTLEGNGHAILNLRVREAGGATADTRDGNGKGYETAFAGLFASLTDAYVSDLSLVNADVRLETEENCFAAALAGRAENTVLARCGVSGRVYLLGTGGIGGVAGLVGYGSGTVADCAANVTLVYADTTPEPRCEEFMGGVLACGFMDIDRCAVTLLGYSSVHGYMHNGGLVGMHRVHQGSKRRRCHIEDCTVDAAFSFFEHTTARRAYCKPFAGEVLTENCRLKGNTALHFQKTESRDYTALLLPETCERPDYETAVTPPSCTEFGYTTYTCAHCGYAYTDDFVLPAHTPGEWELVREPDYGAPGLRQRRCALCGAVLLEEEIPARIRTETVTLTPDALALRYKETAQLAFAVAPADAENAAVFFASSDLDVVEVNADGTVTAVGRGEATVACYAADGGAQAQCRITVQFSWWQWIVYTVLFGFLWY